MTNEQIDQTVSEIKEMARRIGCDFHPDPGKLKAFRAASQERSVEQIVRGDLPSLKELRDDPHKTENLLHALRHANDGYAISVWKDGSWCLWKPLDAKYAAAMEEILVTIPIAELATVTPQEARQ